MRTLLFSNFLFVFFVLGVLLLVRVTHAYQHGRMEPMKEHPSAGILRYPSSATRTAKELASSFASKVEYVPDVMKHTCVSSYDINDLGEEYAVEALLLYPSVHFRDEAQSKCVDLPVVLLVAGQHAREVANPEIALRVASTLAAARGKNQRHDTGHSDFIVMVIWHAVPRGTRHVWTVDRNQRVTIEGGVDPNRNYPTTNWTNSPDNGASSTKGDWTYRGPWPASEPETRVMMATLASFKVVTLINLHSGGRSVLRGTEGSPAIVRATEHLIRSHFKELAKNVGNSIEKNVLQEYRTGASCCAGTMARYAAEVHNVTAFTIETFAHTNFWPRVDELAVEMPNVIKVLVSFISKVGARGW
jgi:hypothetical protein